MPESHSKLVWWRDRDSGIHYAREDGGHSWSVAPEMRLGRRRILRRRGHEIGPPFLRLVDAKAFAEAWRKDGEGHDEGYRVVRAKQETEQCPLGCERQGTHFCPKALRRLTLVESLRTAIEEKEHG